MAILNQAITIAATFIKKWEGAPAKNSAGNYIAFDDKYGNWTIGYGVTSYPGGGAVKKGDIITPEQGQQYFEWHINQKTDGVSDLINIENYTNNQVAALISFAYTAGVGGLQKSSVLAAIKKGLTGNDLRNVWINSYITSNGIKSNGLVNRRKDEFTLYNDTYNEAYSYYLRNEETINKTVIVVGVIAVALSAYLYFVTKKVKK